MVAQNTDRLQDASTILHDSATAITADTLCLVGGSAANGILDIGGLTNAGIVGSGTTSADACFDVSVDVTAMDVASTDEGYVVRVIGSNSSTFASGVALLGSIELGTVNATTGIGSAVGGVDTAKGVGRHILTVRNRVGSTVYRYARAIVETAGTTPSITFGSIFISKVHVA
jgi:hypothetical protein